MFKCLLFLVFVILLLTKITPSLSGTVPIYGDCSGGSYTPVDVCDRLNTNPGHYPYFYSISADGSVYFQCNDNTSFGYHGGGNCHAHVSLCSAPNTWSDDYSTCNTPSASVTCPNGSTAPTLAQCAANCGAGQYNLNGTCTPIPDCNAPDRQGNYFSYSAKGCVGDPATAYECVENIAVENSHVYCPPISDCKPRGYICTDDPAAVSTAQNEKAANLQAALDRAKADVERADKAVRDSQAPVATREMEKAQATTNVATSKAALDAAVANPDATAAQKSAAAQAYADAINASIAASNRNDNTQISASQVLNDAQIAADHKNAIPTDPTSGHGDADATGAKDAADDAEDHLRDTIAGGGLGSGSGQGSASGSGSGSGITSEGVAEGVKKGIKDALTPSDGVSLNPGGFGPGTGSGRGNGTPTDTDGDGECDVDCGQDTDGDGECDLDCGNVPGSFEQAIQDGEDLMAESRGQLDDKLQEIRAGVSSIFGSAISNGAESLPVVDFGTMKGVSVVLDLNKYADQLSIISAIIMALAWLAALSIILGGK